MNKPKCVVYIGGSYPQLVGIKSASKLGLSTVVTDKNPNASARDIADEFLVIDATDLQSFNKLAETLQENYVVCATYGLEDYAALSACMVSEKLGLPYPARESVEVSTDKYESYLAWDKANLNTPLTYLISETAVTRSDLRALSANLEFPLVIKPAGSWGSRGVTVIEENQETTLSDAICVAKSYSNDVLVQEYIRGTLHNVDGLFIEEEFFPHSSFDRLSRDNYPNITGRIIEPSGLSTSVTSKLYNLLEKACRAIGIQEGPVTGDFIVRDEIPFIIEVSTHLHSIHQSSLRTDGINLPLTKWFAHCAGYGDDRLELIDSIPKGFSGLATCWTETTGRVESMGGINSILNIPEIKDIDLRCAIGSKVGGSDIDPQCLALIWGVSESRVLLDRALDEATGMLRVGIKSV